MQYLSKLEFPKMKNCRLDVKSSDNNVAYSVLVDYTDDTILYFKSSNTYTLKSLYSEFKYMFNSGLSINTNRFFRHLKYLEFKKLPTGNYID